MVLLKDFDPPCDLTFRVMKAQQPLKGGIVTSDFKMLYKVRIKVRMNNENNENVTPLAPQLTVLSSSHNTIVPLY